MTSAELLLKLENVVDAFAFDIEFEYDASLIKISSIELGEFFGDEIVCMDEVNDPGLFHYSCTRWWVSTGVSGSGNVFKMTVESLGESGETDLSFTLAEVYDWPNVFVIEMVAEDGNVVVVGPRTGGRSLSLPAAGFERKGGKGGGASLKLSRRMMLSGLALALLLMGNFGHAQAQSTSKLSVEPQTGTVNQDAEIELRFEVEAAYNLNAFELRVNYDAALLSVSSWVMAICFPTWQPSAQTMSRAVLELWQPNWQPREWTGTEPCLSSALEERDWEPARSRLPKPNSPARMADRTFRS